MHVCLCKFQKAIQETSVNEGGKRHKGERDTKGKIKRLTQRWKKGEPKT